MPITSVSKFVQVAEAIEREVIPEARRGDGKIASEVTLAKRFGVSTITVSKALASLVSRGLLERVGGSGTYARQPSEGRTRPDVRQVVAVMPLPLEGHQELSVHLSRELQSRLFVPCVFDGGNTEALCATLPEFLKSRPFGAIIDGNSKFPFETLDELHRETRLVFVSHYEGTRRHNAAYVLYDHQGKGRMAVRHLLDRGRRRIAVINMPIKPRWSSELFAKGCREAFDEAGIEPAAQLCDETATAVDYEALLKGRRPIDGVVTIADHRVLPLLGLMRKRGVRIPDDVAVIGGGDTDWAVRHELTSVEPMERELSREAVNALEDGHATGLLITPRLVFRGSCPEK